MATNKDDWEDSEALAKDFEDEDKDKKGAADDLENFLVVEEDEEEEKEPKKVAKKEDEEEEEDEDEEEEKVQTRYQKRIDQLTRTNREAARRAEAAERQSAALTERLDALESTANQGNMAQFNATYAQVKTALAKAFEEGDTNQQVELTEKMADMRAHARMMQARTQQDQRQPVAQPQRQPAAPPLAMEWWQRNKWFNSEEFAPESAAARAIDLQIEREGYDKDDPEYYEQLDKRLQKRFPTLYKKEKPKRKRSPSAPSHSQKGSITRRDGRLVFTRGEIEMAKTLGLTTKEELTAYHTEIRRSEKEKS